jgi:hypothetical protein
MSVCQLVDKFMQQVVFDYDEHGNEIVKFYGETLDWYNGAACCRLQRWSDKSIPVQMRVLRMMCDVYKAPIFGDTFANEVLALEAVRAEMRVLMRI